ncbi:MAG: DNA cytosine methyltransferase, partial [Clostridia bacterium]|nr:DNA cytosine methyltransferase [Clostridia bacterium]
MNDAITELTTEIAKTNKTAEPLTLGSLFDGIGGFPLAGLRAGMKPVWASEIEPFPIRVTTKRLPFMKRYGDICMLDGAKLEPVDVITGGFPCQSCSIAGKREGIKHKARGDDETTRSGLFYEAVRVIREMRSETNGRYPRYFVAENVPGLFSSAGGEDFRAVLEEICKIKDSEVVIPRPAKNKWSDAGLILGDGYTVAWRVLDAQYFGVAQRRRRVFIVVDFGGERAGKVLFESEGLSGYRQPGKETGQGFAANAGGSAGGGDCAEPGDSGETNLIVENNESNESTEVGCMNPWDSQSARLFGTAGAFHCLQSCEKAGQQRDGVVYPAIAGTLCARPDGSPCVDRGQPFVAMFSGGQGEKAGGIGYSENASPALKAARSGSNAVPDVVYSLQGNGIDRPITAGCNGKGWNDKTMYTLNTVDRPGVVYAADCRKDGGSTAPTLTEDHQGSASDYTAVCVGNGQSNQIALSENCNTLNCMHDQ